MSSAVRKIIRRNMFIAFAAGVAFAHREGWIQRARREKASGATKEVIHQSVRYARDQNRQLVRRLREMSARTTFADYDRERQISATGAFGRVPHNPPAGSIEP